MTKKEVNAKIAKLETQVTAKEREAGKREAAANKAADTAISKQAQAEDALKAVYELAGGGK